MNAAPSLSASGPTSVPQLLDHLRSADDAVRGPAWQHAGPLGASAVQPLVHLMRDPDPESARAARRALWSIVRHAGRPSARGERRTVAEQLAGQLGEGPVAIRRELVWMLSEIGGNRAIPVLARQLADADLREDARCALQRIPSRRAIAALRDALPRADAEFGAALADALRARGEVVEGYPSRKRVPTRSTSLSV